MDVIKLFRAELLLLIFFLKILRKKKRFVKVRLG